MEKEQTEEKKGFLENCKTLISEMEYWGISHLHLIEENTSGTRERRSYNGTLTADESSILRKALLCVSNTTDEVLQDYPRNEKVSMETYYSVCDGKGNKEGKPLVGTLILSVFCGGNGIQFQISKLKSCDDFISWYLSSKGEFRWNRILEKYEDCYIDIFYLVKDILEKRMKNSESIVWIK